MTKEQFSDILFTLQESWVEYNKLYELDIDIQYTTTFKAVMVLFHSLIEEMFSYDALDEVDNFLDMGYLNTPNRIITKNEDLFDYLIEIYG